MKLDYVKKSQGTRVGAVFIATVSVALIIICAGLAWVIDNDKEQKPQQESVPCTKVTSEEIITEEIIIEPQEEISEKYYDIPLSIDFQKWITAVCKDTPFTPEIIYGIMFVETRFQNINNSNNQYCGYMQVGIEHFDEYIQRSPNAWELLPEEQIISCPKANVLAALCILEDWQNICEARGYTDMKDCLEAYNKGYVYFSMTPQTTNYADKVYDFVDSLDDKQFILTTNKQTKEDNT